jgi:hypothetical protein
MVYKVFARHSGAGKINEAACKKRHTSISGFVFAFNTAHPAWADKLL